MLKQRAAPTWKVTEDRRRGTESVKQRSIVISVERSAGMKCARAPACPPGQNLFVLVSARLSATEWGKMGVVVRGHAACVLEISASTHGPRLSGRGACTREVNFHGSL